MEDRLTPRPLTLAFAARAARSGLRRYPRALVQSLRSPMSEPAGVRPEGPGGPLELGASGGVWLGHASVLLRVGGLTVLTDPVLSGRIGPRVGRRTLGLPRLCPAPRAGDLPAIDVVLLSHAHFDHLDRPTLERLARPRTRVIVARSMRRLIPPGFGGVTELDWGRCATIAGVRFTALRPAHWGARAGLDRHRGFNAYVVESGPRRVLFAGDTAATNAFERVGPVDLAAFGIGAYDPWRHAHATPEEVWAMFGALGPRARLLPIHHSTFDLGEEPAHEPLERLLRAARGASDRVLPVAPMGAWAV